MSRNARSIASRLFARARLSAIANRYSRTTKLRLDTLEPRVVPASPIMAIGTDAGVAGRVKVYDAQTQSLKFTLNPYPASFTGGVRVAVADVTGDGTADIIMATGPGGGNKVRVANGATGKFLSGTLGNYTAFTSAQANGVFVAAGDVNSDGKADLIVGSDGNGTPNAKIFNGANGQLLRRLDLSDLNLTNGVRVAAGDVNGDGKADVIVGTSPGNVTRAWRRLMVATARFSTTICRLDRGIEAASMWRRAMSTAIGIRT